MDVHWGDDDMDGSEHEIDAEKTWGELSIYCVRTDAMSEEEAFDLPTGMIAFAVRIEVSL